MYSWQINQWQHITQRANLPHALLLRGPAGTGKHDFAIELAQALLCRAPAADKTACNACPSCVWFAEGGHPDFKLISPEDAEASEETNSAPKKKTAKKSQISVVQIRQLIDYLTLSTHQVGGKRIIIISPADALNTASANALLKALEEPPANTLFLLVTSQPQRLLATITSRCQAVDMPLPSLQTALAWLNAQGINAAENLLAHAGGSPLLAQQAAQDSEQNLNLMKQLSLGAKLDPFVSAPLFLGLGMERAIDGLQKWLFDVLACKFTLSLRYHPQQIVALQALAKGVNLRLLFNFQDKLTEAKKTANHPLSNEAQLENILLQYAQLFAVIK